MKWSFFLGQKLKAAGLLLGLMVVILCTATSLKNEVQNMEQTVVALNADRLQPAVDLVYISESLHAKRLLLEDQFMTPSPWSAAVLAGQLEQYNRQIGHGIGQYEKTKLTPDEAIWLKAWFSLYLPVVNVVLESFRKSILQYLELRSPCIDSLLLLATTLQLLTSSH